MQTLLIYQPPSFLSPSFPIYQYPKPSPPLLPPPFPIYQPSRSHLLPPLLPNLSTTKTFSSPPSPNFLLTLLLSPSFIGILFFVCSLPLLLLFLKITKDLLSLFKNKLIIIILQIIEQINIF
ncbi:unnamed protein product [Meloidogyne enterolobii]|uniref:Uncharacterized protein n=1 Tax=Meloidogyne enterolobii TaxID=390850 RepID=A0ACB0YSG7_MELEN